MTGAWERDVASKRKKHYAVTVTERAYRLVSAAAKVARVPKSEILRRILRWDSSKGPPPPITAPDPEPPPAVRPPPTSPHNFKILTAPDAASVKLVAWAYGCAKRGSDDERQLLEILVAKIKELP